MMAKNINIAIRFNNDWNYITLIPTIIVQRKIIFEPQVLVRINLFFLWWHIGIEKLK